MARNDPSPTRRYSPLVMAMLRSVKMPMGLSKVQQDAFLGEKAVHEPVTTAQNNSLRWLVDELISTLPLNSAEVHRHPDVSRKNATEASTAIWR
ncbi:hypothetical protein [Acidovorax sp. SUPP3334]|uniref:hypothetical protein n=1 Tax=Acidovorax sp. SUPP3334 TaxID=2920881 RepID=UPI0023DE4A5E|nr:hypothetical protein [Acidovorax sp. SUPP3334]GKT22630.1 hypothetical protein AVHM3334_09040 [Acidovorax sp. SUPP3334]